MRLLKAATTKHTKVTKVSDMVLSKILHFVVFVLL
jgi:hypothetical protein